MCLYCSRYMYNTSVPVEASAESAKILMMAAAMVKSREEKEGESPVASARAPACWEMSASWMCGV